MKHLIKKHKGIGLIEVLITTLVVGVGLLSVAALQGNLIKSSGTNKTSVEALQLANFKMEQLRDQITETGYDSIVASPVPGVTASQIITGSNESFFRYWLVTNLPYAATTTTPVDCTVAVKPADCLGISRKRIRVKVAWPYTTAPSTNPTNLSPDNEVVVQSIISFQDVKDQLTVAAASSNMSPGTSGTNANSSRAIHDKTDVPVASGEGGSKVSNTPSADGKYLKRNAGSNVTTASEVFRCSGEATSVTIGGVTTTIVPFIAFENDLYTRRVHDYGSGDFKEAIELAKSNNDNFFGTGVHSCTRQTIYTGGILLPIRGYIYNVASGKNYNLLFTESDGQTVYCTPLSVTASGAYSCYGGGNCANGPIGTILEDTSNTADSAGRIGVAKAIAANVTATAGSNTIVTQCPSHPTDMTYTGTAPYAAGVYSSTQIGPGGLRGRIGFTGRISGNGNNDNDPICLKTSAGVDSINSARGYKTVWGTSTAAKDYGINKPAICQDFFFGNCPSVTTVAYDEIIRNLSTSTGTAVIPVDLTVDKRFCHVITGTMPSGVTTPPTIAVVSPTTGYFYPCTVTGTNYECDGTISAGGTAANITVTSGSTTCHPAVALTNANNYGTSGTTLTCNLGGTAPTTYPLTTATSTTGGSVSITTPSGTSFASGTNVTVTAVPSSGYTVSGWSVVGATGSCGSTSTTCTVTMTTAATQSVTASFSSSTPSPTTHNITGSISTTGTLTGLTVTAAGTPAGVICSVTTGTTNFTCSAVPNTWVGTLTAGGTCNGTVSGATALSLGASTTDQTGNSLPITCTAAAIPATPTWATTPWSGITNPKPLNWNAVSGATGYRVYICTSTSGTNGSSAVTSCVVDTTGSPTPQTGTSYSYTAPTEYDAVCIAVKAVNASGDGAAITKCMYRGNNTAYTYNP